MLPSHLPAADTREAASPLSGTQHGIGPDDLSQRNIVSAILLVAIVTLGLGLRFFGLTDRSFWFDEGISWRLIQFPLGEMLDRVARDNHPPLYFIILKCWAAVFGESEVSLRGLSVLLGGAAIFGIYLFAAEAFGSRPQAKHRAGRVPIGVGIGLLAAALVAVSVFHIRWACEVRMYALGTALAAFSSWGLFRALHAPERLGRWAAYGATALAFAYTHYYAWFSIAVQACFVGGYALSVANWRPLRTLRGPAVRGGAFAGLIIGVGLAAWLPIFLRQRSQVQEDFWTTPVTAWEVCFACYQMLAVPEDAVFDPSYSALCAAICAAILLSLLWRPGPAEWYMFFAAAGPVVISVAVSAFDTMLFHVRYLLFAHLFLPVALARLVWRIPDAPVRLGVGIWLVANGLLTYSAFWGDMDFTERPGARAAADYIGRSRKPGEPVVVCSPLYYYGLLYHADDRNGWKFYEKDGHVVHYEGGAVVAPGDLLSGDALLALRGERVWVVDMEGEYGWGTRTIPAPSHWSPAIGIERRFREAYGFQGVMVVRAYDIQVGRGPDGASVADAWSHSVGPTVEGH